MANNNVFGFTPREVILGLIGIIGVLAGGSANLILHSYDDKIKSATTQSESTISANTTKIENALLEIKTMQAAYIEVPVIKDRLSKIDVAIDKMADKQDEMIKNIATLIERSKRN